MKASENKPPRNQQVPHFQVCWNSGITLSSPFIMQQKLALSLHFSAIQFNFPVPRVLSESLLLENFCFLALKEILLSKKCNISLIWFYLSFTVLERSLYIWPKYIFKAQKGTSHFYIKVFQLVCEFSVFCEISEAEILGVMFSSSPSSQPIA